MPVVAPANVERAAVERDCRLALGQAAPVRRDQSGAGAGAAGAGDAGAALPDPEPDMPATLHRRDADICALWMQLVVFGARPDLSEVDLLGTRHKEGGVRIADIGANRLPQWTEREIDPIGVHLAGERDIAPAGARRPHIDRDILVRQHLGFEETGDCLDARPAVAGFLGEQPGDAAGGVAASLGLTAIGIDDAHRYLCRRMARRLDQDQLIAADPDTPVGDIPRHLGIDRDGIAAPIEHDEIVAEPMHFTEADLRHAAAYMAGRATMSNAASAAVTRGRRGDPQPGCAVLLPQLSFWHCAARHAPAWPSAAYRFSPPS